MTPTPLIGRGGMPYARLAHSSGAAVEVYLLGATITSYVSPAGQPLLYVSTAALFNGASPIRGGIPLAFPQFAMQGPLPMHGFARTSTWSLDAVGDGSATLSLRDSDATRALWPHAFILRLRIDFDGERLTTHLDVENPQGAPGPFSFDALQHSYFYLGGGEDALSHVTVAGLGGVTFLDKPQGNAPFVQEADPMTIEGEVDRTYCNTPAEVVLAGITSGSDAQTAGPRFSSITIKRRAAVRPAAPALSQVVVQCPLDVVVWNAGAVRARAIADLGDEDWRHYICIEPGRVSPATAAHPAGASLPPGRVWTLTQEVVMAME